MVSMPDEGQTRATHIEADGSVSYGAPRYAFGVERADPGAEYELTDEFGNEFGNQIDGAIQEELAPWAEEYEEEEPEGIPVEDVVGDAISETIVMPDQEAAFTQLRRLGCRLPPCRP
jgi:hypothetical protein